MHRAFGHRLRVTRIALGLTVQEAATAAVCSAPTWRKYEETGKGSYCTGAVLHFCERYDVSPEWLLAGEAYNVRQHLHKHSATKIAILPTVGPRQRERLRAN